MLNITSSNDWFCLLFQLWAAQFVLHFTSLLLCWSLSLGEQQRAYLMSPALLWLPKALLFFPKQQNICCQLLHIPGFHGCQAKPPCSMYGTYDPQWGRGHRSGNRKCSSSLLRVVTQILSHSGGSLFILVFCVWSHDISHVCCICLWVFFCPIGIKALTCKSWGLQD